MSEFLINLVKDPDAIKTIYRERSKSYVEKTVSGKNIEIAQKKAEIEVGEGWEILPRKFKKSVKLRKQKTTDVKLEDDIWSLLVRMGFDEFSKDRNFKIVVNPKTNPRQIDVFAKDDQTILLIECTCCEERKEKDLNKLLEKILSIRTDVFKSISLHYGPEIKLKMRWIIATRNIDWRPVDLEKAEANNIVVLRDEEIEYYHKLTTLLKKAAKYQLLAHIFAQEKIHEMEMKVPATRGRMGGRIFYNFLIRPIDLLKMAYISHRQSRDLEDYETYQRMLKPIRLVSIAKYIDNGGQFPTNIVINIKAKTGLRFDKKEQIGESSFGTLYLPNHYASAWVIDGQHRLYGFAYSKRMDELQDKTTFPVLAYDNLPPLEEANLFVDVNSKQEPVKQNLIKEIYANLKWVSEDEKERLDAMRSRTVLRLNAMARSPFFERLALSNITKTHEKCLTLTSFVDGLKENRLFGEYTPIFKPGPLFATKEKKPESTLEKACDILIYYFDLFKNGLSQQWLLGDDKGGFFFTNNGVRCLLVILKEILIDIEYKLDEDLDELPAEAFISCFDEYIDPLVQHFKDSSPEFIEKFRKRQALSGVNQNATEMMSFIHSKMKDFCPDRVAKYLETIDEIGTSEARTLIDEIQMKMFDFVIKKLKEKHGEKWWYDGIPGTIRDGCARKQEAEKGIKDKEQYLVLIDYKDIAEHNWPDPFEKYLSITMDGGKKKKLSWIQELNTIRNITHHVEKWPATKDQVSFVKEVHNFISNNLI